MAATALRPWRRVCIGWSATAPSGYRFTTPATRDVFVNADIVLRLDFGAQFVPSPTPTSTPLPMLDTSTAQPAYCGGLYRGDTRSGAAHVARYACQPAWDESGPEWVYRIELAQAQIFSAAFITTTTDLDLFLLPSANPATCLTAGDTYVSRDLPAGVYFLAVDSYQSAAGSFALRLECPLGPQATATPSPIPSPTPTATTTFTPGPTPTPTPTRQPSLHYLPLVLRRFPGPTPEPVILTLQQGLEGYTGALDTTLDAWQPERSYGADNRLRLMYARPPSATTQFVPLLRFDLTLLPTEAQLVDRDPTALSADDPHP